MRKRYFICHEKVSRWLGYSFNSVFTFHLSVFFAQSREGYCRLHLVCWGLFFTTKDWKLISPSISVPLFSNSNNLNYSCCSFIFFLSGVSKTSYMTWSPNWRNWNVSWTPYFGPLVIWISNLGCHSAQQRRPSQSSVQNCCVWRLI